MERVFTHGRVVAAGRIGKESVRSVCGVAASVIVKERTITSRGVLAADGIECKSVRSVCRVVRAGSVT